MLLALSEDKALNKIAMEVEETMIKMIEDD
jgi:hypothetical protein